MCSRVYFLYKYTAHIQHKKRNYSFNCIKSETISLSFFRKEKLIIKIKGKMHEAGARIQRLILFRFYIISIDVNQYEQLYRNERNTQPHTRA